MRGHSFYSLQISLLLLGIEHLHFILGHHFYINDVMFECCILTINIHHPLFLRQKIFTSENLIIQIFSYNIVNETYIYKSLPHWKQNKYKVWWLHPYADVTDYDNQDSHYSFYLSNTEGNWKTKIHVSSIFYTESLAGRRRVLCILPSVIWASCDTGKYIFMIVDNSFLMIPLWQGTSFFMQFNVRSFRCWSLWNV